MKNIKSFDDLFFDERDFTSSLKNFIAHGIIPGTESERLYFGKIIDYLFKIKEYVQFNWAECDIHFHRNRVTINCTDSETKKEVEIVIDYKDNWISWCGYKLWVPHMIDLPDTDANFKQNFNAQDKFVVGWYGGNNFEITFAREAVIQVARERKDILFLFMNQEAFCNETNVLFIEGTYDVEQKTAFINTCDVMIHARERGETFGLAIAEFSKKNKPIITFLNSQERNHIVVLGNKGIYYSSKKELIDILMTISKKDIDGKEWNCYQEYTPHKVMDKFNKVFLC
jgi:hypothetical protein